MLGSMYNNAWLMSYMQELEQIVCQLASEGGVAGLVLDEAVGFNDSLQNFASDLESEVETIYTAINRLSPSKPRPCPHPQVFHRVFIFQVMIWWCQILAT